jgi:hypothetical protein
MGKTLGSRLCTDPKHHINKKRCSKTCFNQMWCLMPGIPVTWEVEIGSIVVQDQPGQKLHKTPSQPIRSWTQWYAPVIPAMWEA